MSPDGCDVRHVFIHDKTKHETITDLIIYDAQI